MPPPTRMSVPPPLRTRRPTSPKTRPIDKANGKPRIWQVLRLARIEKAELVKPTKQINIPNMPVSELRKWSFDNGTDAVFITDQRDLAFIKTLPGYRRTMRCR